MTILIVLVGLAISQFATGFRRWRSFAWLIWPIEHARRHLPWGPWRATALVLAVSFASALLASWLASAVLGMFGWVLLALAVFIYTLGPRDLDLDVNLLLGRRNGAQTSAVVSAARAFKVSLDDSPADAAAAVLHAALSRWFGVLFWFVVLGIPGAVLYRLTRVVMQSDSLNTEEIEWLVRLRVVLDWPVIALMLPACALCGDLDRVYGVWRQWRGQRSTGWFSPELIDRLGVAIAADSTEFDDGLRLGHQMVWRMLILWLSILSLALLAGWLA